MWTVFEPNDEQLWSKVRLSVSAFLHKIWQHGMLAGNKPDAAYYVRCDRTTMTADDISNGRLKYEIGIAPMKPAEFMIIRIRQDMM